MAALQHVRGVHVLIWRVDQEPIPEIGDVLKLVPGHCDPTVNMHDSILGHRNGVIEEIFDVSARGPGF